MKIALNILSINIFNFGPQIILAPKGEQMLGLEMLRKIPN